MFQIDIKPGLADKHYNRIKARIENEVSDILKEPAKNSPEGFEKILIWLNEEVSGEKVNIKKIITAKPSELLEIYNEWKKKCKFQIGDADFLGKDGVLARPSKSKKEETEENKKTEAAWAKLSAIFDYAGFIDKNKGSAYELAEDLNVQVCPYCNRSFTSTVSKGKICRPEFDHYFPKSRFPMFALSFYNLIPCCHTCNSSIKGTRELDLTKHFHPYIEEENGFKFRRTIDNTIEIEYDDSTKERAKATCDFFKIEPIYQSHKREAIEIRELYEEYPIEKIHELMKALRISEDAAIDLVFSHYSRADEKTEVLGKLRKDLFDQTKKFY